MGASNPSRGFLRDLEVQRADDDHQDGLGSLVRDPYAEGENDDLSGTMYFQYNPETIKREVGVTWNGQIVPGHSHRRLQWGGGGARTWAFTLKFHLDSDDKSYITRRMRWLEALTLGTYDEDGNLTDGPHRVLFGFGKAISVECVVLPFSYTYGPLFDPKTLEAREASVDLKLEEFVFKAESADDYRNDVHRTKVR